MINHVRTLLLNQPAAGYGAVTLEEYVAPNFRPRVTSQGVVTVFTTLFGSMPDREMLNYRLRQLIPILHIGTLEKYTLRHDSRVTYLPLTANRLHDAVFTPTIMSFGSHTGDLSLVGTIDADSSRGQMRHQWRITVLSSTVVAVDRLLPALQHYEYDYTLTQDRSNLIPLPGSLASFSFTGDPGTSWLVTAYARPARNLGELTNALAENVTEPALIDIFGTDNTEPMRSYRELWLRHLYWPYRLCGLLLGVSERQHTQAIAS